MSFLGAPKGDQTLRKCGGRDSFGRFTRGRRMPLEDRFWEKVKKGTCCWEWTACRSALGYGKTYLDGKYLSAHRLSYFLAHGKEVPEGMTIDHLCRNPSCVRPDHLEVVSMKENTMRGLAPTSINAKKYKCNSGHAFDEANTYVDGLGKRHCKACRNAAGRRLRRRRKALKCRNS